MDLSKDPCDDFFQYACGTWNKKHVIPEDRSSISTFEVMNDQLDLILRSRSFFIKKYVYLILIKTKSTYESKQFTFDNI